MSMMSLLNNMKGSLSTHFSMMRNTCINTLLQVYSNIFPNELPNELPPQYDIDYHINLYPNMDPPSHTPYQLSYIELEELQKQLCELLDSRLIYLSKSPFSVPILFIWKKDSMMYICIDYQVLNKVMVKNKYLLLRIDDLLDWLVGAVIFTKIDLCSGYYQICMALRDIYKMVFNTYYKYYKFLVMLFGLINTLATFQILM